ncbi:unnamed protein product [Cylindrotheca closterium]|uniref:AB hydrolase-1 domain-containing protein n=1 Tax=Cylindrotheca closterium TaxID=2856 RepID=A0AAD2CDQ3_9STRA|nr:unnamed protein product [Cylindrotheca closterium]
MRTRNIPGNRAVPSSRRSSEKGMPGLKASTIADMNDEPLETPIQHMEEPLLNYIPKALSPIYRGVPWFLDVSLILLSLWASAVTTWKRITWLQPLAILKGWKAAPTTGELVTFFTKALLLSVFARTVIQDLFLPPSRVPMRSLLQKYFLPSSLSKYETLSVLGSDGKEQSIGVHFLEYTNPTNNTSGFDALYVNHGFGASSLSWLPVIPTLTKRLGARVCLGHDAAGFGFTDRPDDLGLYMTRGSGKIAANLLLNKTSSAPKSVALLGHSLGCLTTLKMALELPKETSKLIVLCAPALGIRKPASVQKRKWYTSAATILRENFFYPVFGYTLRRAVGGKNFWRRGLETVWGDKSRLRDNDVLRFQWPSVGLGWERGILEFARAQLSAFDEEDLQDDRTLLRRVMDMPNTKVMVILGGSDRVIPASFSRNFFNDFGLPVQEMVGLGHDPFEEKPEEFSELVDRFRKSEFQ